MAVRVRLVSLEVHQFISFDCSGDDRALLAAQAALYKERSEIWEEEAQRQEERVHKANLQRRLGKLDDKLAQLKQLSMGTPTVFLL
jgi:hypothetical protein